MEPVSVKPSAFLEKYVCARKHCENIGRDYRDIRKGAVVRVADSAPGGSMEDVIKRIDEYKNREIGLVTFLFDEPGTDVTGYVKQIAKEVLPRFNKNQ